MHHTDGTGRAVAGAVAAAVSPVCRKTPVLHPYRVAYLDGAFLLRGNAADGSRRAYLRAERALRAAISPLVGGFGLHKAFEAGGWAQHAVGAG